MLMETQRQWNDQAIADYARSVGRIRYCTPSTLSQKTACSARQTAWYRKTKPTFSDALAWAKTHLANVPDRQKPTTRIVERLIDIVSYVNG